MRPVLLIAVGLLAVAVPVAAQVGTAEQLRQSQVLYDQLELERAARLLRALLSPQWTAPFETAQRVGALKLLGATLALMGRTDSAVVQFRNALQLDPFVDLEPEEFTPAQVGAFAQARRRVFAVGTRPVAESRVDPRVQRIRFVFATTHAAAIRAELRHSDSVVTVFESGAEGVGEIVWDGLTRGRLAPPGRYELRLHATSRLLDRADSASTYFDLRTETTTLEDTLPSIAPGDLLPERTPRSAGAAELAKGLAIAGGGFRHRRPARQRGAGTGGRRKAGHRRQRRNPGRCRGVRDGAEAAGDSGERRGEYGAAGGAARHQRSPPRAQCWSHLRHDSDRHTRRRGGHVSHAWVAAAAIAALVVTPRLVAAQRWHGGLAVSAAEHRVDVGAGNEVSRGPLLSARLQSGFGARWIAALEATVGALTAQNGGADRDVAQLGVTAGFRATPWLTIEAGFGTRVYSAAIARQRWTAAVVAAEGRLSFAGSRLAGTGRVALQPMLTVSDLDGPNVAVAAAAGVEYRAGRATFGLSYWLERYDFPPAGGLVRHEQLTGLMARGAWSAGHAR